MNGLLLNRSTELSSNLRLIIVVLPPWRLAGVGITNPCNPLSPRKAATSGLDAAAWTVAIKTPLENTETVIGVFVLFLVGDPSKDRIATDMIGIAHIVRREARTVQRRRAP